MLDLEWRKFECFFEYHTLLLMRFPSLDDRVEAWSSWLSQQRIDSNVFLEGCLLGSGGSAIDFPSREGYHKVAKLAADIMKFVRSDEGVVLPATLLDAIDAHAQGVGQWLKVAGMEKAELLESALLRHGRGEAGVAVEFGAFVGYTSVRLASLLSEQRARLRSVSLEVDHVHQAMSRHLLDIARLTPWGEVWNGQVRDLLPRIIDELGAQAAAFAFMDHRGTRFHADLAQLRKCSGQAAASHVVADNVLNPGAPVFAWNSRDMEHMTAWRLSEFMSHDREDWMVVVDVLAGGP